MEMQQARAIELVDFEEEQLASGRKLLHAIFKDKYGDRRYRWTPPWRDKPGTHGVETLFFKALEVESWNDYEGVWSEELKRAADLVPGLKELTLPVKVVCSGLEEVSSEAAGESGWDYKMTVSVLTDEEAVGGATANGDEFSIGRCKVRYKKLLETLRRQLQGKWRLGFGKRISGEFAADPFRQVGASFSVWLPKTVRREDYPILSRQLAIAVRSHLVRVLSDFRGLQHGFEEPES